MVYTAEEIRQRVVPVGVRYHLKIVLRLKAQNKGWIIRQGV